MSFIYEARITQFSKELKKYKSASRNLGFARLVLFLLMAAGIYLYWGQSIPVFVFIVGGGAIFLRLVVLNSKADLEVKYLQALISINENEKLAVSGNFENPENGEEFIKPNHEYSNDFDLFGKKSFFSKFNRTVSIQGKGTLANWLTQPELDAEKIVAKQAAIKELVSKLDWRQEFLANGMLNQITQKDEERITKWHNYQSTIGGNSFYNGSLKIIPVITIGLLVSSILGFTAWSTFGYYLLLPLGYVSSYLKRVNYEYGIISNLVLKFEVLANLTEKIENENFDATILKQWKNELFTEANEKASLKIKELKSLLAKFEQRNNMLMGILLNAFLLWDIQLMHRMNFWKQENSLELSKWIAVIGNFDSSISLANMAYNNPALKYPVLSKEEYLVKGKNIKHPMLNHKTAVGNNFTISGKGNVNIVTGANMAGKSTFLRTIGLNMVIGMMGAPVPAEDFTFSPMMIFSSMRTEDSLAEQTSFFYAELSRLAKISDILKTGEKRFVILDEILKGTNSHDKARGSYAFVEKMINYNMMGLIATHDLSLCELAEKHPNKIANKSFEVEFENDELVFDYKLQNKVCQNMNASFLLKKMGIVDHY
ncbi:MAG: MutS-related protein [Salibacteraceae bacterium]